MTKNIVSVVLPKSNNAMSKAKEDITNILVNNGFNDISITEPSNKFKKLNFNLLINKLKNYKWNADNDVLVFQYPTMLGPIINNYTMNWVLKNKINSIVIIHDIDSIRFPNRKNYYSNLNNEINFFDKFNFIIVPNEAISKLLRSKGINGNKIIIMQIYDYLDSSILKKDDKFSINEQPFRVSFAGNLDKATFLSKLKDIKTPIDVFGDFTTEMKFPKNVTYKGSKSPEEISQYLSGFGLIWDGSSCDTCLGNYGNYLKYNSPHKLSLYIVSKIPVIIWKHAAMANFVEKNNIGFTIDKISDIDEKLSKLTMHDYDILLKNVKDLSNKLLNGYFTLEAVNKSIEMLGKNNE